MSLGDWFDKLDPIASGFAVIAGIGAYFNLKGDTKRALALANEVKEDLEKHYAGQERRREAFSELDKKVDLMKKDLEHQGSNLKTLRRSVGRNNEETRQQLTAINLKLSLLLNDKEKEHAKTGTPVRPLPD